jgi:GTP-binding protein
MSEAQTQTAFSASEIEAARKLFAGPVTFLIGVAGLEQLPPPEITEVAFAGRSNVGKSSLLNALVGRRDLARTSNTPGRTRQINFFGLGPEEAPFSYLVDLPGYGYARAAKAEIAAWTGLVQDYLQGRPNLRRVMLLIDARHGIKPSDFEIMKILDAAAVNYQIVLTKIDKLKAADHHGAVEKVGQDSKALIARHPEILATSAVKGWGVEELRATVAALALE